MRAWHYAPPLLLPGGVMTTHNTTQHAAFAGTPAGVADWNGKEIAWLDYEAGLAEAKATEKPVLVVFHANWCPHCRTYRKAFYAPEIISLAKSFITVIVDIDDEPRINRKYGLDGTYIPRTMVVNAKGVVRTQLRAKERDEYQYFVDPRSPDELLDLMVRALEGS